MIQMFVNGDMFNTVVHENDKKLVLNVISSVLNTCISFYQNRDIKEGRTYNELPFETFTYDTKIYFKDKGLVDICIIDSVKKDIEIIDNKEIREVFEYFDNPTNNGYILKMIVTLVERKYKVELRFGCCNIAIESSEELKEKSNKTTCDMVIEEI